MSGRTHKQAVEGGRREEKEREENGDCTMRTRKREKRPPPTTTQCALTPSICETTTPSIGTTPAAQACGTNDAGEAVTIPPAVVRRRRVGRARSFRPSDAEAEANEYADEDSSASVSHSDEEDEGVGWR